MIDPKQGPFPILPRRGRNAAAWIGFDVGAAPWRAIDDLTRPIGRSIDEQPASDGAVAIDKPPSSEPHEDAPRGRWIPEQPSRQADPEIPNERPVLTDRRPRAH